MLMPSIFGENLLEDFFVYPQGSRQYHASEIMKTDIKDIGSAYELTMNLPGIKKEDVKAQLKDGYLTIGAVSSSENEKKDGDGTYIRRERYMGSCSRSFYVGNEVKQENIKAKFDNGTLKLTIPKTENKQAEENKSYIAIEG